MRGSPASRRLSAAAWALAVAVASVGCRETVYLEPPEGGTGGSGGDSGSAGMDGGLPNCTTLSSSIQYPDVIVALDRSMAMLTQFPNNGDTRLIDALNEISSLANQYQAILRLGYVEFPAPGGLCQGGGSCCAGDPTFPKTFNQNAIYIAMHACDNVPGGCMSSQRPIADALNQTAQTYSRLANDGHNRYAILITADDPACMGESAPCSDAQGAVVNLVNNNDVTTYVVGVGSDLSSTSCLDKLANLGRAPRTSGPPYYYPVRSSGDMTSTLGSIAHSISQDACVVTLDSPPSDPSKVQVLLNGIPLSNNDPDGWSFAPRSNDQVIELQNGACDTLVQSAQTPDLRVCQLRSH